MYIEMVASAVQENGVRDSGSFVVSRQLAFSLLRPTTTALSWMCSVNDTSDAEQPDLDIARQAAIRL